ncbi:MAG: type IX secretion system outer membrane channel protein PorV [Saprospiraceae bacterium]|nr:type IX secretion system outer membrane channel protein PorV [Saprospiraceae bacterium]
MRRGIQILSLIFFLAGIGNLNAQFGAQCDPETGRNPITGEYCLNSISTAVPFLRIVPDARSGALGDAGIAISADANAMHFNPSKLVFAEKDLGLSITYTPWLRALGLTDVYMAYLTGYKKLDEFQTVGAGLRYFSLGSIQFTDNDGNLLQQGRPYEFEFALAYARKLSDNFSASITGKFIFSDLASGQQVPGSTGETIEAGKAGAADIGLTYQSPISMGETKTYLRTGLAITNIGSKITYTNSTERDFLPGNLGLGAAWDFELDNYNTLTLIADFNKLLAPTPDSSGDYRTKSVIGGVLGSFSDAPFGASEEFREIMYSFGIEYWYDKQFAVRAGYFNEHASKGNRKYLTLGIGLKYNIFGLNLSYLVPTTNQQNPLDNTLRFTLLFDFGVFGADE